MAVEVLRSLFEHLDTANAIQTIFMLQAITVLFLRDVPVLNRTLSYGARQTREDGIQKVLTTEPVESARNSFSAVLNTTLLYPVPHAYFVHFYIVSVISSIFWGIQILGRGSALRMLSPKPSAGHTTMSIEQIFLVWSLTAMQGLRRLYESITLMKRSSSTMPITAYLVGILYYLLMGVGIWIEGAS